MRVNIYAEEMTDRIEIIEKVVDGHVFTALRFYLELPASYYVSPEGNAHPVQDANFPEASVRQMQAPFIHRLGDDDSSAVTFWGKKDLRAMLVKAIAMLNDHYANKE